MKLSIIVAAAKNGVIGSDNALPWHLPEDLKYFKRVTMGKPVVMGRKTYESIGRPLPGRTNIVITRNPQWQADGVLAVPSLDMALEKAQSLAVEDGADELFVIGGEQIYRLAVDQCDRIYLTRVDAEVEGDAFFAEPAASQWREVSCTPGTEAADFSYRFLVYERR
jgi:dihydrofolate reductase